MAAIALARSLFFFVLERKKRFINVYHQHYCERHLQKGLQPLVPKVEGMRGVVVSYSFLPLNE